MTTYYKVLTDNGNAHHGGVGRWPLPNNGEPGAWKQVEGYVIPCENGLHVCARDQLVYWLGPAIFVCEVDDTSEVIDAGDKTVVRRARLVSRVETWNERTARLFAADCAERVLRLVEKSSGQKCDPRSHAAVCAAREFAVGNLSVDELAAAEVAAARAAAAWAAWDAAWAAAAWAAWDAARAAAWAAWDAARAAARAAAWKAAWAAERKWQTKRLFEYLDGKRGA